MTLAKITIQGNVEQYILPRHIESCLHSYYPSFQCELVSGRCGYDLGAGWNPARCGNTVPCAEHSGICQEHGFPAIGGCVYTGMFVCGSPVCEKCNGCCELHRRKHPKTA